MLALRSLLWAILLPGFFAGFLPWRYFGLRHATLDWSDPVKLLGLSCAVLGGVLLAACIVEFARSGRGTLSPLDPPRRLVVRGLYKYVRNPMYLSVTMIVLGEALIARSQALAVYWAIWFLWVNLFVMGYEEPALRRQFGGSYDDYTRKVRRWLPRVVPCCILAVLGVSPVQDPSAPLVDHHQHLFSPAAAALVTTPTLTVNPITAADLVGLLDAAGIRRAVVLSMAYTYGHVSRTVENEYDKVKAENDWTSQQVSLYPDRLLGFCSFNLLKEYAQDEFDRCVKDPRLRSGLKFHFGNADVDVHNAQHLEQLRRVFRRANEHRMTIIVHMRSSISRKRPYGRDEARIFLTEILPAAPDVPIQIAHLAGGGGYDDPLVDQALSVFTEATRKRDPRVRNLYFDVSGVVRGELPAEQAKLVATRIRELGVERVLYGSDAAAAGNLPPREAWAAFRKLPLTDAEFTAIAGNVAPYLR